jgi:hypothetical protein
MVVVGVVVSLLVVPYWCLLLMRQMHTMLGGLLVVVHGRYLLGGLLVVMRGRLRRRLVVEMLEFHRILSRVLFLGIHVLVMLTLALLVLI